MVNKEITDGCFVEVIVDIFSMSSGVILFRHGDVFKVDLVVYDNYCDRGESMVELSARGTWLYNSNVGDYTGKVKVVDNPNKNEIDILRKEVEIIVKGKNEIKDIINKQNLNVKFMENEIKERNIKICKLKGDI